MLRFLVRRILSGIIVLWVIVTAVFFLFFVASPGDPARLFAGRQATEQTVTLVRHQLGLDQPVHVQYGRYLKGFLQYPPNLGESFATHERVLDALIRQAPVTLSVAFGAAVIWMLIAIPIGVLAATRPRSLADRGATIFALAGMSLPSFVLGMIVFNLLFFIPATKWNVDLFQVSGWTPLTEDPIGWLRHLVLPWITLALLYAATYSRLTRGSLLETLGEDYIRTARAKGLTERTVVYKHGLRPAITPIVTLFGLDFGALLGGTIIVEKIFGLPGIGQYALNAVTNQDLPAIMGTVLFAAFFVVVMNIVVDIAYAFLDPRVRLS
jgi:peptide/nickel transport system permease protein